MYKFKRLPVFTVFDMPRKYDGHTIEPYTLYHWRGGCSFGQFIDWDTVKQRNIVSFVRPSRLRKNLFCGQIERVMENEALPESVRKGILNKIIGWLGKTHNKRQRVELFENEVEARRLERNYGEDACECKKLADDLWMVKVSAEEELVEGFLPIHKMVYDSVNKHIRDFKKELESKGINVIGVHGDSLFVSPEDALKLQYPEKYECKVRTMGLIKKEPNKNITGWKLIQEYNTDVLMSPSPNPKTKVSAMKDEWSAEEASQIFSQVTPVIEDTDYGTKSGGERFNWILTADEPGSGKSHTAITYVRGKTDNYMVACYSNEQALEWKGQGVNACTVYTLCGARPGKEDETDGSTAYEYVVIDELGMFGSVARDMIRKYMERNKETTQFFATEDLLQIPPIESDWNGDDDWYRRSSAMLFSHEIHLTEPKRFTREEDRHKIKALKRDLFGAPIPQEEVVAKYAKKTDISDVASWWAEDTLCVSYTHKTREKVNEIVHNHRGYSEYFVVGQNYVCMRSSLHKEVHKNCVYELVSMGSEKCTLRDILNLNEFEIKREKLVKENLSLPYCRTGHVVQGRSVSGNVVIFDSKLSGLVTRNWLYVVLTRARDLSKVFYVENVVETMCARQIENKIWGYKKQDIAAGRFWKREKELTQEYIQGMSKKQGHVCFSCVEA